MKVIIPLYCLCSMLVAAKGATIEDRELVKYQQKVLVTSYEGGASTPYTFDDGCTAKCTTVTSYLEDAVYRQYQNTVLSRAYIEKVAAEGASQLREKVRSELDARKTVAINFMVPDGLPAIPAYTLEFEKEIDNNRVTWALCFVDVDTLDDAYTQMIYGDTTVLIEDFIAFRGDFWGNDMYLALRFLCSTIARNGRVIAQSLMGRERDASRGCLSKHFLKKMHQKLNPERSDLKQMIDKLDYCLVQCECLPGCVVLPYDGDMPGVWRDVHDGLDPEHQDKKLIVTPVIVHCDADGRAKKADFEFALCQSKRAALYLSSPSTQDLSAVISATIIVHKEGDNIRFVSNFLYVTKKNRDLLKKHEGQVVMALSNAALADVKLKGALTDKLEIPVNSISLNMSVTHPQMNLRYKLEEAVPVINSITETAPKRLSPALLELLELLHTKKRKL